MEEMERHYGEKMRMPIEMFDFEEMMEDVTHQESVQAQVKRPSMYKVLLLNDSDTPMDYVIYVLQKFFHKKHEEAIQLMMEIHHGNAGLCGLYTREIAETKMTQVVNLSREHNHPLKCVIERQ